MKRWKKIVLIVGLSIIALAVAISLIALLILPKDFMASMFLSQSDPRDHLEKIAWDHDLKPLQKDFGHAIKGMKKCYWKGGLIGGRTYYYAGFIVLDPVEFENLTSEYTWMKADPDFKTGLEPEITGYHDFEWAFNQDFSDKVLQNDFYGAVDLDLKNGVIFLYVEVQ